VAATVLRGAQPHAPEDPGAAGDRQRDPEERDGEGHEARRARDARGESGGGVVTVASDWKLPAERVGRPAPADLVERRAQIDAVITADPGPGVVVSDRACGGVDCLVCEPDGNEGAGTTVLYFHGGGYRLGA